MSINSEIFKIRGHKKDCLKIKISNRLTATETDDLRKEITKYLKSKYDIIYLDTKDVVETDLSGINEIINSFYTLEKSSQKLILIYKKNSVVEKWVATTGLDKFIETAIIPE